MNDPTTVSAGLAFMRAAHAGIGKSVGDRDRSAAMNDLLDTAIRMKMQFDLGDCASLARLGIRTCVGVFDPMDMSFYRRACVSGGTYAKMWEAAHGAKPFKAVRAGEKSALQSGLRVAQDVAVLLAGEDEDDLWPRVEGHQVWWVTSVNFVADTITICRYRLLPDQRFPYNRLGRPGNRLTLSRKEWEEKMAAVKPAKAARAA